MEKSKIENDLYSLIPTCCKIGFASLENYSDTEKIALRNYLPEANTVLVLAHHIQNSLEWVWYPFENERRGNTCSADLHSQNVLNKLEQQISSTGYKTAILPYPGICGLMFKTLATKTNLGKLGDNYCFMNKEWGPWIHLRILLTNAILTYDLVENDIFVLIVGNV